MEERKLMKYMRMTFSQESRTIPRNVVVLLESVPGPKWRKLEENPPSTAINPTYPVKNMEETPRIVLGDERKSDTFSVHRDGDFVVSLESSSNG